MNTHSKVYALCLFALSTSLFTNVAFCQETKIVNLHDAIVIGLTTNPEYGVVAANRRATDEALHQGQARFLPSIDISADAGREHSDDPGTRAGLDSDTENLWRRNAGITLTQMLFDGWDSYYEVERQEARVLSSAHRAREKAELIGLAIVEDYLDVIRQRRLLQIAMKNVEDHITILQQMKENIAAGRSTPADGAQARVRLALARSTEAGAQQNLTNAEAQYLQDIGQMPVTLEMPKEPANALKTSVNDEIAYALDHSPTLDIYRSDINVAQAEVQQTGSSYYPKVDMQLGARNGYDLGGVSGEDTSASALVTMNWNLYRGGADTARKREFLQRREQARQSYQQASRALEHDIRQTWASMIASGDRAEQFYTQAKANEEVVLAYKDQFEVGRRSLLDVLDSQNELFASRNNFVNAKFLEKFSLYRLLALKGQLLSALEVTPPPESLISYDTTESN